MYGSRYYEKYFDSNYVIKNVCCNLKYYKFANDVDEKF